MNESEVIQKTREILQAQGFKLKGQPNEGDIVLLNNSIRVDLQGFRESSSPDLIWVECKGGNANLKELLSDFTPLLVILDIYGGQAILACPSEAYEKLMEYKDFLDKLQKNISKGEVIMLNVETNNL